MAVAGMARRAFVFEGGKEGYASSSLGRAGVADAIIGLQ